MSFSFSGAARGGTQGAMTGSMFGPIGTGVGAIAGGLLGAFGKDIDKGVTGNSGSGITQGIMNMASMARGGVGGGGDASGFSPSTIMSFMDVFNKGGGSSQAGPVPGFLSNNQLAYQNQANGIGGSSSPFGGFMDLFARGGTGAPTASSASPDLSSMMPFILEMIKRNPKIGGMLYGGGSPFMQAG